MTTTPYRSDLVKIQCRAQSLAGAALILYWKPYDDFHRSKFEAAVRDLLDLIESKDEGSDP